jgi:hypothetical protein
LAKVLKIPEINKLRQNLLMWNASCYKILLLYKTFPRQSLEKFIWIILALFCGPRLMFSVTQIHALPPRSVKQENWTLLPSHRPIPNEVPYRTLSFSAFQMVCIKHTTVDTSNSVFHSMPRKKIIVWQIILMIMVFLKHFLQTLKVGHGI